MVPPSSVINLKMLFFRSLLWSEDSVGWRTSSPNDGDREDDDGNRGKGS
jgi:hypothetical protein